MTDPAPAESAIARLIAPTHPSRLRLALIVLLLLAWVAFLVILYRTNVRPMREHEKTSVAYMMYVPPEA